jgi:hypothetical protein
MAPLVRGARKLLPRRDAARSHILDYRLKTPRRASAFRLRSNVDHDAVVAGPFRSGVLRNERHRQFVLNERRSANGVIRYERRRFKDGKINHPASPFQIGPQTALWLRRSGALFSTPGWKRSRNIAANRKEIPFGEFDRVMRRAHRIVLFVQTVKVLDDAWQITRFDVRSGEGKGELPDLTGVSGFD